MAAARIQLHELSLNQLVRLTGRNYRTIKKRLEGLEPLREDGKSIFYDPKEALPLIYEVPDQADDLSDERARLAREQADAQALKNAEARGELVRAERVLTAWQKVAVALKEKLRALPARARRRIRKLTLKDVRVLRKLIAEALEELAEDGLSGIDRAG